MAQAKKKASTKTARKTTCCKSGKSCKKSGIRYEKYQRGQKSNMFFIISMSVLAATLLFANLLFIVA